MPAPTPAPLTPQFWAAPTHRDRLVADHGLDAAANPTVHCACGRYTLADQCLDITSLPAGVRAALGLDAIDFLCDGCLTRLYREQYLPQATLLQLLGAPAAVLAHAQTRDQEHTTGIANRAAHDRPRVPDLNIAALATAPPQNVGRVVQLPLRARRRSHADSARALGLVPPNPGTVPGAPGTLTG